MVLSITAYVASVWNSYRKASLLILNVIMGCHQRINTRSNSSEAEAQMSEEAAGLMDGIVSSLPYLLAADVRTFVEDITAGSPPLVPGRPVGALLSMQTLNVLSTLPLAETKLKAYIRNCLSWIGTYMGIGQATILSKVISA